MPRFPLRTLLLTCLALACLLVPAGSAAAAEACDRFAGASGSDDAAGTEAAPVRTVQRLADILRDGQTGCLMSGIYDQEVTGNYVLRPGHGGAPGAPITIRSAPGQRATLRGIVYIPEGSDHITLSRLDFDARGRVPDDRVGITVTAADTVFEHNTVTNQRAAICMVLGSPGWGQAVRTVVRGNVFTDCGGRQNNLEHSLYVEWTSDVLVTDNLFDGSGAYAVHLYPSADRTTVTHNVMVNGGGGVIFAGEGADASTNTVVAQNVISGSVTRPGIHSYWGDVTGTGNVARDNCLFDNVHSHVELSGGGFASQDNVIAAPSYRNAGTRDFRLRAESACLPVVGYDTVAKLTGEVPAAAPQADASDVPGTFPTGDGVMEADPVEGAVVRVDARAFSFSGGTPACQRKPRRRCR